MISPQEALVYTMVAAAEADREIAQAEIELIGDLANHLPIFRGIDRAAVTGMALRETAYALACDVIAVDSRLNRAELHMLEKIRAQLEIDPAMARAIEQVAEVRFKAA